MDQLDPYRLELLLHLKSLYAFSIRHDMLTGQRDHLLIWHSAINSA